MDHVGVRQRRIAKVLDHVGVRQRRTTRGSIMECKEQREGGQDLPTVDSSNKVGCPTRQYKVVS